MILYLYLCLPSPNKIAFHSTKYWLPINTKKLTAQLKLDSIWSYIDLQKKAKWIQVFGQFKQFVEHLVFSRWNTGFHSLTVDLTLNQGTSHFLKITWATYKNRLLLKGKTHSTRKRTNCHFVENWLLIKRKLSQIKGKLPSTQRDNWFPL